MNIKIEVSADASIFFEKTFSFKSLTSKYLAKKEKKPAKKVH